MDKSGMNNKPACSQDDVGWQAAVFCTLQGQGLALNSLRILHELKESLPANSLALCCNWRHRRLHIYKVQARTSSPEFIPAISAPQSAFVG